MSQFYQVELQSFGQFFFITNIKLGNWYGNGKQTEKTIMTKTVEFTCLTET